MTLEDLKEAKSELDTAYSTYLKSDNKTVGEAHFLYKQKRLAYMSMCAEYVEQQVALAKVM